MWDHAERGPKAKEAAAEHVRFAKQKKERVEDGGGGSVQRRCLACSTLGRVTYKFR